MSMKNQAKKTMVASNDSDDDVGALIYRESQLRKAEAAEAAAESKKISTISASTRHRTSTRKRTPVKNQSEESLPSSQRKGASKRIKRESSWVAKKKYRYECSADGCTNIVVKGGVCIRHGAKTKRCSSEGCANIAQKGGVCIKHGAKIKRCSSEGCTNRVIKGGMCIRHGAKVKRCSSEGCTNRIIKGGVCIRHGAKVKRCSSEGCTNIAQKGGVCVKHGAKIKRCSSEGCTNKAQKGGMCIRHGARVKLCSSEGCTNHAKRGGLCWRHGAYRNTNDQSTAFGSEFEMTTATQTLPNQRASRAAVREGQERSRVPQEVAILCQEIVEV